MNKQQKIPGYWNMQDNKIAFMAPALVEQWLGYSDEEQVEIEELWKRNIELDEELRLIDLILGSKN